MENGKDINPIGFDIPTSIDGMDKNSPTNIIETRNPPDSGGGNQNNPNEPGQDPDDMVYPPDHDPMTNDEIIYNHLLSQREHRKFIDDRRAELAGQQAIPLIGMVALAYIIFS